MALAAPVVLEGTKALKVQMGPTARLDQWATSRWSAYPRLMTLESARNRSVVSLHEIVVNWMARHGMTLAEALGPSRRVLAYYRSGESLCHAQWPLNAWGGK